MREIHIRAATWLPVASLDPFLHGLKLQLWILLQRLQSPGVSPPVGIVTAFVLLVTASVSSEVRRREWVCCVLAVCALIGQTLAYGRYLSEMGDLQAFLGISFSVALIWIVCLVGKSLR